MRMTTREQAIEIDRISQENYGLSGESLMEAAGALMARHIFQKYYFELKRGPLVLLCGPGNNGGDALVVARHLKGFGVGTLKVYLAFSEGEGSALNQLQLKRLIAQNIVFTRLDSEESLGQLSKISQCPVVVDGLFGVGLNREIQGHYKKIIESANRSGAVILSLDIASGLDANRGVIQGAAIRATESLCVGLTKPGQWVQQGPQYSGRLSLIPIGFPRELIRAHGCSHFLFGEKLATRYLPQRDNLGNKSNFGRLLVAAGHPGTLGAGLLTAKAALRMGAGYVGITNENPLNALKQLPELLTSELDEVDFTESSPYNAIVAGPGFGLGSAQRSWLKRLVKSGFPRVILDADALTLCREENLFPLNQAWVITPHAGELSRLIGWSSKEIEARRFEAVAEATQKLGCIVLLKGYRTVIGLEKGFLVVESGNGALAKAGTGDVLSGFIGALLAQGRSPLVAAATAAYLHGRLADDWVAWGKDPVTLTPSDLIERIGDLLTQLKKV